MNGFLIYNPIDIDKNQWFINHFITLSHDKNIDLVLITTKELYDSAVLSLNTLSQKHFISSLSWDNFPFKPDFVINRSRDSIISTYFESQGIQSFNSSKVVEICNDKVLTYQYLLANNLNFLPYRTISKNQILSEDFLDIINSATVLGYPLVLKPAEGHGGSFVTLISDKASLINELLFIKESYSSFHISYNTFILQKCASNPGRDLRVYMMSNSVVAGILRSSDSDFRANFSLGGKAELHFLTDDEQYLIDKVSSIFNFDFVGIDFVYDNGKPVLNEIEDAVGCRMLYANTNSDIVETYLDYILSKTKKP